MQTGNPVLPAAAAADADLTTGPTSLRALAQGAKGKARAVAPAAPASVAAPAAQGAQANP